MSLWVYIRLHGLCACALSGMYGSYFRGSMVGAPQNPLSTKAKTGSRPANMVWGRVV